MGLTFSGWDERLCRGTQKSGTPLSRFLSNIAASGSPLEHQDATPAARLLFPSSSFALFLVLSFSLSQITNPAITHGSDHFSPFPRSIHRARHESPFSPVRSILSIDCFNSRPLSKSRHKQTLHVRAPTCMYTYTRKVCDFLSPTSGFDLTHVAVPCDPADSFVYRRPPDSK